VAGVAAAGTLPAVLAGPFAGVLADRWDPRRTMIACDVLRALLILTLVFAPVHLLLPCIYVVGFSMSLVGLFFNPSKNLAIRSVIGEDQITRAQGLSRVTESIALILGPVLGSSILLLLGPAAGLALDALTFCVGAVAVALVRLPGRGGVERVGRASAPLPRLLMELRAGVRITLQSADLVTVLAVNMLVSVVGYGWFAVDIFFVEDSLGAPRESVGLLWTASGGGGLVGGLAVVATAGRLRQSRLLLAGLGVMGGALVWYSLMTSYTWALPAAFASGFGGALLSAAMGGILLQHTPQSALGRVTALFETLAQVASIVAILAVALMEDILAPSQMLLGCGLAVCAVFVAVAPWLARRRGSG
jgi:MFS family permease